MNKPSKTKSGDQPISELAQGKAVLSKAPSKAGVDVVDAASTSVPPESILIERTKLQWQLGDWQSLSKLSIEKIQHHPDRQHLALLAASGHIQTGEILTAKELIAAAKVWGCSDINICQILTAGVYNNLGRIALLNEQEESAQQHYLTSIKLGTPKTDVQLLAQARCHQQMNLLGKSGTYPPQSYSPPHQIPRSLELIAKNCLNAPDPHEAIDAIVLSDAYNAEYLFFFYVAIANELIKSNDKVTAAHFLQEAQDTGAAESRLALQTLLIKKLLACGRAEKGADIAIPLLIQGTSGLELNNQEQKALINAYNNARKAQASKGEHGHDLLLSYLRDNTKLLDAKPGRQKPVLIEIGTTRENVPGQGSTRKLADFCKRHSLHFITVDMDPHNTRMAKKMFAQLGVEFEAVTMKGEDYLQEFEREIDFVFLDAYDFDHGKHSNLRQNRYQKFLGSNIDEKACHQMHLECAESVASKLSSDGLVCIDDTWLEDNKWTAKGTLAMPFLVNHGFKILEARNRAALLTRDLRKASCPDYNH